MGVALERKQVTLEQLSGLDGGKLARTVQAEIAKASVDIHNRPKEERAREVTIKLKFVPGDEEGERVTFEFEVSGKIPSKKSNSYAMGNNGAIGKMTYDDVSGEAEEADDNAE